MINAVYQLFAPRLIDVSYKEIDLENNNVIIRPTYMAICNADQRYYQGLRPPATLKQKLPMALIHECVARVIYDPTHTFRPGDMVVPVPTTPVEQDDVIAENYLRSSYFRSSGYDGFLQDYVEMPADRLVLIPKDFNMQVVAFTEIVSVAFHAISRFDAIAHRRRSRIGIWGDGVLGHVTSLLLSILFPDSEIYVFGTGEEKLSYFSFADQTFNVDRIPPDLSIDHAFECVGGHGSQTAINQIIDYISPEGVISIMGVSETNVNINTRMILEKGLRLSGSSRSGIRDFQGVIDLYSHNPNALGYFENLISRVVSVQSVRDIHKAFSIDINKGFGKTIMEWNI